MTRLASLVLAALVPLLLVAAPASAGPQDDYNWVRTELHKKPAERNKGEIDRRLAAIVEAGDEADPDTYAGARAIQAQRRIAGKSDLDAPEARRLANDARAAIVAELGKLYLNDKNIRADARLAAYGAQLLQAYRMTSSRRQQDTFAKVLEALVADVDARYLADEGLGGGEKESVLRSALKKVSSFARAPATREPRLKLYDRLIALGTAGSKSAYLERAALKNELGRVDAAAADLAALAADPQASAELKFLAHVRRMDLLADRNMWAKAAPDAAAVNAARPEAVRGSRVSPADVAAARRRALKVVLTAGELDAERYAGAATALMLETLTVGNIDAEAKSAVIADLLMDLAAEPARARRWDAALGLARSAYTVAPNTRVPATVSLIQKLLANRSRRPLTAGRFDVSHRKDDLASSRAFYARQRGSKEVVQPKPAPTTAPAKKKRPAAGTKVTVVLAPDLSNDARFPRQLEAVGVPFDEALGKALRKTAADCVENCPTAALAFDDS